MHHAVFTVLATVAAIATFLVLCLMYSGRDPVGGFSIAKDVVKAQPASIGDLMWVLFRAAVVAVLAGIIVRVVGAMIPARCGECRRWAVRRVSTRPMTLYRCASCGASEGVAVEDGGPVQEAVDDIASARVDQALHEASPAAGQLSAASSEGGAVSPAEQAGKVTLKDTA